jgi:outer membrane lipopolysaccharide assembly protein LptE/RlpB
MQRRTALFGLTALGLSALGLSACGFQPRGVIELPPALHRVSLAGSPASGLTAALELLLRQNGAEIVAGTALPPDTLHIRLSDIRSVRREALIDSQANVRALEFILRAHLHATTEEGNNIIDNESFEAVRSMSYNPLSLLAQGEEEQRLQRELEQQLAQSMLTRLRTRLNSRVATP